MPAALKAVLGFLVGAALGGGLSFFLFTRFGPPDSVRGDFTGIMVVLYTLGALIVILAVALALGIVGAICATRLH